MLFMSPLHFQIDDNTFPNIMAILVGYNSTLAFNTCQPTVPGKLESCPFIWKDFRDAGYVTAYGEDEADISSFNYHKTGFVVPPTDFYLRPYMLGIMVSVTNVVQFIMRRESIESDGD